MEEQTQQQESPELQLQRETVRRLELEAKARREIRDRERTIEETKQIKFGEEFKRQLAATKLSFHGSDDELQIAIQAKTGAKFLVRNDGQFAVEVNGQQVEFAKLVEDFAVANRFMLQDSNQVAHLLKPKNPTSKADFKNDREKSLWISEHSVSEWEELPLRSVAAPDVTNLTRETWFQLSTAQKNALGLSEYAVGHLLHHGTLKNYDGK